MCPLVQRSGVIAEQLARLAQLGRDDHRWLGQLDRRGGRSSIAHAQIAGARLQRAHQRAPAADRVARRRRRVSSVLTRARPDERRRQLARVVVEGVHAGRRREHRRGALVGVLGRPGAEVEIRGRLAAAQPQHSRERAERRGAPELALPAQLDAGQRRTRVARAAACVRPASASRDRPCRSACGPKLALYGPSLLRARPPSALWASSRDTLRAAFGAGDRGGQSREPAPHDRDLTGRARFRSAGSWRRSSWRLLYTVTITLRETGPVYSSSNGRSGITGSRRASCLAGPELLVELDRDGELPLHEQLERSLRENIRRGRLPAGTRLPSTRGLAAELGVSRGVVTEAYGQLGAEGYLETPPGRDRAGRTSGARRCAPRAARARCCPPFPTTSTPACPTSPAFPATAGCARCAPRWRESPLDAVGYGDPRGVPRLREALADYLGRVRGAAADPENMLMCTGFMQGFSILCRWLHGQGIDAIAVEDPGWQVHRLIAEQAGLRRSPCRSTSRACASMRSRDTDATRGARDAGAPVPHRQGAQPRAPRGADRMGRGAESG